MRKTEASGSVFNTHTVKTKEDQGLAISVRKVKDGAADSLVAILVFESDNARMRVVWLRDLVERERRD